MHLGINTLFLIPGQVGGAETYLREVLQAMLLLRPELAVTLFTNHENDAYFRERVSGHDQVTLISTGICASNRFSRIIREQTQLPQCVRQAGVDLLWSPGYTCPAVCPCPQVTSILDMQYKHHTEDFTPTALMATRLLVALAARRSARVITISQFSAREIHTFLKLPMDRIHPTLLGVDPAFGVPLDASRREECLARWVPARRPFILAVSNTYPHKQMHLAVEAFDRIKKDCPHSLLVVGQPRLGENAVTTAITRADAGDRIQRIHYLDRESLVALYQAADAFVFPSVYEGFGLPVLEALMAGTPVVATRCGAVPEVGGDCVTSFEAGSVDGLCAGLKDVLAWDGARRAVFKTKAQAHASRFSWSRTAQQTLACFDETFSGWRSTHAAGS